MRNIAALEAALFVVQPHGCGRSSGVEHNLAKVGVVSSNLIARSKITYVIEIFNSQKSRLMADTDDDLVARHAEDVTRRLRTVYEASRNDPDRYSHAGKFAICTPDRRSGTLPPAPHDADYRVFRNFSDEGDLIIDVGANSGYSAESIWASGSGARVLSFEALHFHLANLEALKRAYGDRFDYRLRGLGNAPAVLEFVMPVVNGVAITPLATASSDIHWQSLARNTICFGDPAAFRRQRPVSLDLAFYQANVERLDDALKQPDLSEHNTSICAIKIDVEGMEPEVVEGAQETLCRQQAPPVDRSSQTKDRDARAAEGYGISDCKTLRRRARAITRAASIVEHFLLAC